MDPIELERRMLKAEKWTARYRADAIVAEKRVRELDIKLLKLQERHEQTCKLNDGLERDLARAKEQLASTIKSYEEQGRNVKSLENSVKILREEVAMLRKVPVGGA